jgi:AsmA family
MARVRTYAKWIAFAVVLLILVQTALPYALRNRRMRAYLTSHLEKSFGRRVEARGFSMVLLPLPQLEVDGVSVAEDPAFGQEYFLQADKLTAGVRWFSLLRGHFDLGTISLTRPSLILVRNEQGRWNLEGWLPPAPQSGLSGGVNYGPQRAESANHLQKIEFDEGRINFKTGDEKRPFAFTGVSGSVEQVGPGRWELRLEAEPWRSGVALQSTGTLQVRGEVAGTSSRLQPAQIQVHWEKVSLADLFRLITGNDFGVRGEFALDGDASIGKPVPGEPVDPGIWKFSLHARAGRIHRWDLIERSDNPGLSVKLDGIWDVPAGEARAETALMDLRHSHFEGAASLKTAGMSEWDLRVKDAGVEAQDLLAWCRAFQPDIAEGVSARQFFKARFGLHGRPLVWDDADITSDGGELNLPGFAQPVHIGAVQGSTTRSKFLILPVRLTFERAEKEPSVSTKAAKAPAPSETGSTGQNLIEIRYLRDFSTESQSFSVSGRLGDVADLFKAASAFGRNLNAGWELTGPASGAFQQDWNSKTGPRHWNVSYALSKAKLQAAGMNLPLQLDDVRANWSDHGLSVNIARAAALGAIWNGTINETADRSGSGSPLWGFQLHADHLDAANLDLWFGPRARPNWLQRLLPSLLGKSASSAKPSELLRRISAEGDLTADSLTAEKVKLAHPRAHIRFRDLHLDVSDVDAEWAGGAVRGNMNAVFSVPPQYEISAVVERASLAQFPWGAHWADRWNGTISGKVHLTTSGVGRDALLEQLAGAGQLWVKPLELHGWDVAASLDGTAPHTGSSRWATGEGEFTVKNRAVQFDTLQLENPREKQSISGEFRFSQEMNLAFIQTPGDHRTKGASPQREFLLAGPLEKPVASVQPLAAAQAKKEE